MAYSDICSTPFIVSPRHKSLLPAVWHEILLPFVNVNSCLLFVNNGGLINSGKELNCCFNLPKTLFVDSCEWEISTQVVFGWQTHFLMDNAAQHTLKPNWRLLLTMFLCSNPLTNVFCSSVRMNGTILPLLSAILINVSIHSI